MSVVDEKGYLQIMGQMPRDLEAHGLPADHEALRLALSESSYPYGAVLFKQLSPSFMQGQVATYYLGETFAQTLQPRRSSFTPGKNGFTIEHMTQRVQVAMLAVCDWDGDGKREWLVSCRVVPKRGGHEKTWYLLVPEPENSSDVLKPTAVAIWDCLGLSCQLIKLKAEAIDRRKEDAGPLTEVKEFTPGEQTVTTPPEQKKETQSIEEHSL
ncbi:MAG: hypothetical protein K6G15_11615 [Desulfovibrio sp.]|nr:hypothetical protein [Desulfovibrio sp.]